MNQQIVSTLVGALAECDGALGEDLWVELPDEILRALDEHAVLVETMRSVSPEIRAVLVERYKEARDEGVEWAGARDMKVPPPDVAGLLAHARELVRREALLDDAFRAAVHDTPEGAWWARP